MYKANFQNIKRNRPQATRKIRNWLMQLILTSFLAMLIACMAGGVLIVLLADTVGFVR